MASSHLTGLAIVIMGVSGTGKSTVAESIANTLGFSFIEGDDIHPPENKVKMSKGIPLSDIDRIPWLQALRDAIHEKISRGENVTLSCSALQSKYREILRAADSDYKTGEYTNCRVKFVCLEAPVDVIADRMMRRSKEGTHFMPSSLLQSQLDLLQVDDAEGIAKVDATMSLEAIVDYIVAQVKDRWSCMQ